MDSGHTNLRDKIIGLGESSFRKNYYPELQQKLNDLERFRVLLDQSNDAIFLIELPWGRLIDANRSACSHFGYSYDALSEKTVFDILNDEAPIVEEFFSGTDKDIRFTAQMAGNAGHTAYFEVQMRKVTFDGTVFAVTVARDITERKTAEDIINNSLKEKEVLLKEIHHRVKNNLQIISSLLSLQSDQAGDNRYTERLRDSQNRIKSMAFIHEKLYCSSNLAAIDFNSYIFSLVVNLFRSYGINMDRVKYVIDIEDTDLDIDTAMPCGLIINELVSNSLKYAFPDGRNGTIYVSMKQLDSSYVITVKDDGIGLPENVNEKISGSLGLSLVDMLVIQLNGTMKYRTHEGTEFVITFPEA